MNINTQKVYMWTKLMVVDVVACEIVNLSGCDWALPMMHYWLWKELCFKKSFVSKSLLYYINSDEPILTILKMEFDTLLSWTLWKIIRSLTLTMRRINYHDYLKVWTRTHCSVLFRTHCSVLFRTHCSVLFWTHCSVLFRTHWIWYFFEVGNGILE